MRSIRRISQSSFPSDRRRLIQLAAVMSCQSIVFCERSDQLVAMWLRNLTQMQMERAERPVLRDTLGSRLELFWPQTWLRPLQARPCRMDCVRVRAILSLSSNLPS